MVENVDFSLSDEFKASFLNDVLNGVAYLHGTAKLAHGALNLHSCIVTPQWTVRISNYGLNDVMRDSRHTHLLKVPPQNLHGA